MESIGKGMKRSYYIFNMFREDQDRFGLRSHAMADQAVQAGHLSDIVPVQVGLRIRLETNRHGWD